MDADQVVGTHIAGYRVESVLGRGGMGVVYVARQRSPDRKVALKLISPLHAADDPFQRRFLRETFAAAAIDHPHILPVYDAGESDGTLFMAMRLVEGEDLGGILRAAGHLDPARAMTIVEQIGGALDAAHARGLVHRDVKPGNILVARQADADQPDFCYLTDFGVSTWITSAAGTMTSAGHIVGSMHYAAPEQIEGKRAEAPADLYGLGCVLYECLTGRPPFAGRSPAGIMHAHLHEEPPPPSSLLPGLPSAVDAAVSRSLRKDPQERYASCRELTRELRAALSGGASVAAHAAPQAEPSTAPRARAGLGPRTAGRQRKALWVAAAAITAVVVTLVSLAVIDGHGSTEERSPTGSPTAGLPQLIRAGVQVTASHTAGPSKDAAGNVVTYLPSNVVDGDVQTAWRTPGDGHGETITLLFDRPVDIVEIGLIPGYAKFDPKTAANRFEQDRIISEVRYLIPGLAPTVQRFQPKPYPQLLRVRATASRVTVEILETSESGGLDYTAISEIFVYGFPHA